MSRGEFTRWLRANGCYPVRNNSHEAWDCPATGKRSFVPNHRDLKANTARRICDQLGIPRHPSLS